MNYYRRYCGDYAADTPHLTMLEHGAYTLMLDAYYTSEKPLPDSFDLLYRICRAQTPLEKKAVRNVAEQFFPSDGEFRHNGRADKELSIAVPKMAKLREVAQVNGAKNKGKKRAEKEPAQVPVSVPISVPVSAPSENPSLKQPPSANHQPPTPTPESQHRFPGVADIPPPEPKAVESPTPTPADMLERMVAECARARLTELAEGRAIVERWARNGGNPAQVAKACAEARRSMPEPREITVGYVSSIVERIIREDAAIRRQAEASHERTQQQSAAQREAAKHAVPMPEDHPARALLRKAGHA
jgi:uncharacterized protein YdaU (DUF1376 family)